MNRRFFISTSASALVALIASFLGASCAQESVPKERPMQIYEHASFLWQRLLRRHRVATVAARAPGIEDVKTVLTECANFPLCQHLQKEIEAAKFRGEAEERETAKRAEQYTFNPTEAAASPAVHGNAHEVRPPEETLESDVLGVVATSTNADELGRPQIEMDEGTFRQAFGDCFEHFGKLSVTGVGEGEALTLKKTDACQEKPEFFDLKDKAVLIAAGKIESIRPIEELHPIPKIFYQGKEISSEQQACILRNYERAKTGDTSQSETCFPEDKPEKSENSPEVTTIGSL